MPTVVLSSSSVLLLSAPPPPHLSPSPSQKFHYSTEGDLLDRFERADFKVLPVLTPITFECQTQTSGKDGLGSEPKAR